MILFGDSFLYVYLRIHVVTISFEQIAKLLLSFSYAIVELNAKCLSYFSLTGCFISVLYTVYRYNMTKCDSQCYYSLISKQENRLAEQKPVVLVEIGLLLLSTRESNSRTPTLAHNFAIC